MKRLHACLLAGVLASSSVQVMAAEQAMIVLDASGSMWGQINGKPKLQIAREALATVLEGVPADMELGLIAYGHREKGNCNDIEVIIEPAAGTGPAITQAAANMKFLGKTPLSAAVKQAAEALRYTEDKATVILITDGLETCKADPCALGTELAQNGIDFTAHVVGFDLTDAEGKQVACLAENTGGQYIAASNADELRDALISTVVQPVLMAEQPALEEEPELVLPIATLETDASAAVGADIEVNWTGPNAENDYIDIVPEGHEATNGDLAYIYTKQGTPLNMRMPAKPGAYDIRYIWRGTDNKRHVLATTTIQVADTEAALIVPDSVQAGSIIPVEWNGPASKDDYIDIVPADQKKLGNGLSYFYPARLEDGKPGELKGPTKPGQYQVRYVLRASGPARLVTSVPLTVTAATASISIPDSAEAGSLLSVFWTGPAGQHDYIDLVPADQKSLGNGLSYFYPAKSEDGETGELKGPTKPGQYLVRYVLRGGGDPRMIASTPLTVTAVEASLMAPDNVSAGSVVTVSWTGPARKDDYIDLVPADQKKLGNGLSYFYPAKSDDGATGEVKAPKKPGQYLLRYVLRSAGPAQLLSSRPLTVIAASAE
ncbi:VWA domain-containing protein [Alcaligenaceae bacterium]|nr:VWA domain-containing protein [Alcaligenaceae bacterium]